MANTGMSQCLREQQRVAELVADSFFERAQNRYITLTLPINLKRRDQIEPALQHRID
jgi:hypothetical protein